MPALKQEIHCSCVDVLNFFILSVVRGTTPLMMFFGVYYLQSAGLVVAFKCGISLILFTLSGLLLLRKSEVRTNILKSLQEKSTYWKLLIVGILQSAAPYLLAAYSVNYIPISLIAAFLVTTPWWIYFIERSPLIKKDNKRFSTLLKVGMSIGILGIITMLVPIIMETANCASQTNITSSNILKLSSQNHLIHKTLGYCHPMKNVLRGLVAILSVPIFWAAAAVFWRRQQGDIHYIISSIGQNVFGGIIATIVWLIFGAVTTFKPINWGEKNWIIYIMYLGVATGWLGTLLVRYLFSKLGSKTINQVLTGIPLIAFIEDCVFIRDAVSTHSYTLIVEMIGLLFVTAGVFISNVPVDDCGVGYNKDRTEALLTSEYVSEGMNAGMNQILRNQIHQYEPNLGESDDNADNDDAAESLLSPLDPENKVNYPILTEVS